MSFGGPQSLIALAIFVATYAALALRGFMGARVPIWLVLLLGAATMVFSGSIGVQSAYTAINLQVIVFLFSMFVLVTALDISGGLEMFVTSLIRRARNPRQVLCLTFVGFALLSSVLMNDTIALMGTPMMISLARRLKISVKPLLLSLAFAVTTGSVMTPMGNPQNLLVAVASGLNEPVIEFARYLFVPTVINVVVTLLLLRFLFAREITATPSNFQGSDNPKPADERLRRRSMAVVAFTMLSIVLVNIAGSAGIALPFGISEVSLFGAVLMLGVSGKSAEIVKQLDWGILVMFASLFVLMQAVSDNGIISALSGYLPSLDPKSPSGATGAIIASSVLLSQVLSNVPMVALYIPLMKTVGFGPSDSYAWTALAGGSTLAGNLTLLGAASNLIIVEAADRSGFKVGFFEFLKVGVVLTAVQVAVLYVYLYLV